MTKRKRTLATLLALLMLIIAVFAYGTVNAKSAQAGIYTRLSVKLEGGDGKVYAEAKNEFTLFPATVRVYVELYRSDSFEESYNNMQLVSSNYVDDLDQGERVRAYASTEGRRAYYLARIYYKIDSDDWTEKTMGVFRFDGNGNELYGLPVYSDGYLDGITKAVINAGNEFTADGKTGIERLCARLKGLELDKVGAMPSGALVSIEFDNGLSVYAFADGTLYFKVIIPYADGIYRSAERVDFAEFRAFIENLENSVEIDLYQLIASSSDEKYNRFGYTDKKQNSYHTYIKDKSDIESLAIFFKDIYAFHEIDATTYNEGLTNLYPNEYISISSGTYFTLYAINNKNILLSLYTGDKDKYEYNSRKYYISECNGLEFNKIVNFIYSKYPPFDLSSTSLSELIFQKMNCEQDEIYETSVVVPTANIYRDVKNDENLKAIAEYFNKNDINFIETDYDDWKNLDKSYAVRIAISKSYIRLGPIYVVPTSDLEIAVQDDGKVLLFYKSTTGFKYYQTESGAVDCKEFIKLISGLYSPVSLKDLYDDIYKTLDFDNDKTFQISAWGLNEYGIVSLFSKDVIEPEDREKFFVLSKYFKNLDIIEGTQKRKDRPVSYIKISDKIIVQVYIDGTVNITVKNPIMTVSDGFKDYTVNNTYYFTAVNGKLDMTEFGKDVCELVGIKELVASNTNIVDWDEIYKGIPI